MNLYKIQSREFYILLYSLVVPTTNSLVAVQFSLVTLSLVQLSILRGTTGSFPPLRKNVTA